MCLGFCAWGWLDSGVFQYVQSRRLDALLESALGRRFQPRAGSRAATPSGGYRHDLIGRIEIERVGISAIIAEGVDSGTLRRAVGHVPSTALPGEPGNVVLAGHRDSFFRRLKDVKPGDRVTLTTPEGVFDYDIDSTGVVGPTRTEVLSPSDAPSLTLITCYPFNYIGPAPDRFIVRARQAG